MQIPSTKGKTELRLWLRRTRGMSSKDKRGNLKCCLLYTSPPGSGIECSSFALFCSPLVLFYVWKGSNTRVSRRESLVFIRVCGFFSITGNGGKSRPDVAFDSTFGEGR